MTDGFLWRELRHFFDIKVTFVNSKCNLGRPSQMVFKKRKNKIYAVVIAWLRTRISFKILRLVYASVNSRGLACIVV